MPNTTQKLVEEVYENFGKSKYTEKDYVKEIIILEIEKLMDLKKKVNLPSVKAKTLMPIADQNQIAEEK